MFLKRDPPRPAKAVHLGIAAIAMQNRGMMKIKGLSLLLVFFLFGFPGLSLSAENSQKEDITWQSLLSLVSPNHAYQYIEALTSPKMEGRQAGTEGAERSARYIEQLFQGFGLKGFQSEKEEIYSQPFPIQTFQVLSGTSLRLVSKEADKTYAYRKDFTPMMFSSEGQVSGAVVFAGYGISKPDMNWDDYHSTDVKGKVVLIFRKSPDFTAFPNDASLFKTKIETAKKHGAIGLLMMDKPVEENRFAISSKAVYTEELDDSLPAMFISQEVAKELLITSGSDPDTLYQTMEEEERPIALAIKAGIEMKVNFSNTLEQSENIIGIIPAANPEETRHVIVCAHYDHLGKDLVNNALFPGANDNASGTAVLIELARIYSSFYFRPAVNIVFIAFSGEEEGLIGSVYYTEHPIYPLEDTLCVLNMDMVGTGSGKLFSGTDQRLFSDLADAIQESSNRTEVETVLNSNLLRGGSDHVAFVLQQVPSVFFIRSNPTGLGGYHSEDDVISSISLKNLEEQIKLVLGVVWIFADAEYFILDFTDHLWNIDPIYHPRVPLRAVGSEAVHGTIDQVDFTIDSSGLLRHLVRLQPGEHVIHLEVLFESRLVYEKYIHYLAEPKPELLCDFNYDYAVNFTDSLHLAKQWNNPDHSYEKRLADVNEDSVVDETDFSLFNQSFGYTIKP